MDDVRRKYVEIIIITNSSRYRAGEVKVKPPPTFSRGTQLSISAKFLAAPPPVKFPSAKSRLYTVRLVEVVVVVVLVYLVLPPRSITCHVLFNLVV
ncbi:hypothetical protein E2C01_048617 [Portunus trituberculatus]|uniref:Uncharacterized protein n=1 Tax=Portunus trituberculatus TaxID=210409 RepID=A0A5B7GBL7_PORTR|nr:hypothetical protein [Portunus trituberculatus]